MRLAFSGLVPLMLLLGLLMAPVTCSCGAAVPHGYSLFQLPFHSADAGEHERTDSHAERQFGERVTEDFDHQPHPLAASALDGKRHLIFSGTFMLVNALEKKESAVVKVPPGSSFGQPMMMAYLSSAPLLTFDQNEPVDPPETRMLEGTATSPEPPPPRV